MAKRRGSGEGSIYRFPARNCWAASFVQPNGKRKTVYAPTQEQAIDKLHQAQGEVRAGRPATPERTTIAQYLSQLFAFDSEDDDEIEAARKALLTSQGEPIRPRTWVDYRRMARMYLVPAIGRVRLGNLAVQHVNIMLRKLSLQGLSTSRVHCIRAVLSRALTEANATGLVPLNVARIAKVPRGERIPAKRRAMSADVGQALIRYVADHRLSALFTLALMSGARQGELLGLQWEYVDLNACTIRIEHSMQRIDRRLQLVEPKTAKSHRTIPLHGVAIEALKAHKVRQIEERLRAGRHWQVSDLVFTNEVGKPLEGTSVTQQLYRLLDKAGLPRHRFHDLRHAYATAALKAGVHHRYLMELMGHSEIGTTLNIYVDVDDEAMVAAGQRAGAAFAV